MAARRSAPAIAALVLLSALLGACASFERKDSLQETLDGYASAVRFGTLEQMLQFIDPETLAARPPTSLQIERHRHIRITGYREGPPQTLADGRVRQTVGISFVNQHTMVERSIIDQQQWRYDTQAKRWWLESGLFDITAGR